MLPYLIIEIQTVFYEIKIVNTQTNFIPTCRHKLNIIVVTLIVFIALQEQRTMIEMSKWVSTRESTWLTTGLSRVGLRKIQLFQKWVELNPAHLTHGLNGFEAGSKVGWPT